MILAAVVQPNGATDVKEIDPADLHGEVGGFIELIRGEDWFAAVDEDGKRKGLPMNQPGTLMAKYFGWEPRPGDYIVGPVVFFGMEFVGGEDGWVEADLPQRIQDWLVSDER